MKAYYPINLPEWLGDEACCLISEKGSTEFSIPCIGHVRGFKKPERGMQKCTLPKIEITCRHPRRIVTEKRKRKRWPYYYTKH